MRWAGWIAGTGLWACVEAAPVPVELEQAASAIVVRWAEGEPPRAFASARPRARVPALDTILAYRTPLEGLGLVEGELELRLDGRPLPTPSWVIEREPEPAALGGLRIADVAWGEVLRGRCAGASLDAKDEPRLLPECAPTAPTPPTPPEPPRPWCPPGFTRTSTGLSSRFAATPTVALSLCVPPPDAACGPGERQAPDAATCARLGPPCPRGFEGIAADRYVSATATAGDGSADRPFGDLTLALAGAHAGDRIAIRGPVELHGPLPDGVALVGVCPTEASLALGGGREAKDLRVERLRVTGGHLALGGRSALAHVELEGVGLEVDKGAELTGADLRLGGPGPPVIRVAGGLSLTGLGASGVRLEITGSATISDARLGPTTELDVGGGHVRLRGVVATKLELRTFADRAKIAVEDAFLERSRLQANSAVLGLRRVTLRRERHALSIENGPLVLTDTLVLDARDSVVATVQLLALQRVAGVLHKLVATGIRENPAAVTLADARLDVASLEAAGRVLLGAERLHLLAPPSGLSLADGSSASLTDLEIGSHDPGPWSPAVARARLFITASGFTPGRSQGNLQLVRARFVVHQQCAAIALDVIGRFTGEDVEIASTGRACTKQVQFYQGIAFGAERNVYSPEPGAYSLTRFAIDGASTGLAIDRGEVSLSDGEIAGCDYGVVAPRMETDLVRRFDRVVARCERAAFASPAE